MAEFAFVVHPIDAKRDIARKYPGLARVLPTAIIELMARLWPPIYLSQITGVRSGITSREIEGALLACPLTARQMLRLPPQVVYRKVVQTGYLAQDIESRILGLGAFTSVVGDGGVTISERLQVPVTTGNSLTVSFAVEGLEELAARRGIPLMAASVAVVGATGSIGLACAEMLAPLVRNLLLVGREENRLTQARARVEKRGALNVKVATAMSAIRKSDLVLSATNSTQPIILPQHLKHGALVCDVALPSDVSPRVKRERKDVSVLAGGIVDVPGDLNTGFDFDLPAGKTYACLVEVMVLALEERYENYSLGKHISIEKAYEIAHLAHKHGFEVAV
jgi:predicted amino acid dehydrogenase